VPEALYLMMVVAMAGRVKLAPHVHDNGAGGQHGGVPAPHNGGVSVARQQLQHCACQHLPHKKNPFIIFFQHLGISVGLQLIAEINRFESFQHTGRVYRVTG